MSLDVSGEITRTELSLAVLDFVTNDIDVDLDGFDEGELVPRYDWADADWVTGALDCSADVHDNPTMILVFVVDGHGDHQALKDTADTLVQALRQNSYKLKIIINTGGADVVYRWDCSRAQIAQTKDAKFWLGVETTITARIPRQPDRLV